jgi:hypothetical protein
LGSAEPIVNLPSVEEPLNRSVLLAYRVSLPEPVKTVPPPPRPTGSKRWKIKIALSGSIGHAGVGGAAALGQLMNADTGEVREGSFQGGGPGVGLALPAGDPGFGDWTEFTTDGNYTFEDFDGALARLTMIGAGIGIIGYSIAYISFPTLGANTIPVGGWNMGGIGADGSTNVGWWNVIGL